MNHRAIDRLIEHQTHARDCGCGRAAGVDRRTFLGGSVAGTLAAASATAWLPRVSLAGTAGSGRDTLVVVFLRGGMDGLTLCAPYGDAELYLRRPTLAIRSTPAEGAIGSESAASDGRASRAIACDPTANPAATRVTAADRAPTT